MSRPPIPEPTYACRTCLSGQGWISTSTEGRGSVKPCPACQPTTHTLWVAGHFAVNHRCKDCSGRRKGNAA